MNALQPFGVFCQCSHGVLGSVPTPPLLRHQSPPSAAPPSRPGAGWEGLPNPGSLAATARDPDAPGGRQPCAAAVSVALEEKRLLPCRFRVPWADTASVPILASSPTALQARRAQGSPAIPERRVGPRSWRSGGARGAEPAPSPSLICGARPRGRERGGKMGSSPPSPFPFSARHKPGAAPAPAPSSPP